MSPGSTIYVVDRDETTCGLVRSLGVAMQVTTECFTSAEDFLSDYNEERPGCVISEWRLMGMSGLDLQDHLTAQGMGLPVIFLTSYGEIPLAIRAMRNGAITVLEKPCSQQELWEAIRVAMTLDGQRRQIDQRLSEIRAKISRLTPREREVLDAMIAGRPNKSIARQMNLSLRTIEACRQQIFRKTQAKSVPELVRMILQVKH
jgi:FixJ family two-component response regulator